MTLEPLLIIEPNPVRLAKILEIFNPFPFQGEASPKRQRQSRSEQVNQAQATKALQAGNKQPLVFQIQLAQTTEQAFAAIQHAKEIGHPFMLTLVSTDDQEGYQSFQTYQKIQDTDPNISILSYGPSLTEELSEKRHKPNPMSVHIGPNYNFEELWTVCKSIAFYRLILRKQEQQVSDKASYMKDLAHDLGTPLQTIMGLSESLIKLEKPTGPQLELLKEIANQSHRICDTLEKHRSNVNTHEDLRNIELINLNECLAEVSSIAQILAESKGIQLVQEYPQLPLWILGDGTKIRQAMLELINFMVMHTESKTIQIELVQHYEDAELSIQSKLPPNLNKTAFLEPNAEHLGNASKIIEAHGSCLQVSYFPNNECKYLFQIPMSLTHYMNIC